MIFKISLIVVVLTMLFPLLFLSNVKASVINVENSNWKITIDKEEKCDKCPGTKAFYFNCLDKKVKESFQFILKNNTGQIRENMLYLYESKLIVIGDISSVHNIVTVYDLSKRVIIDEIYCSKVTISNNRKYMAYLNLSARNTPIEYWYNVLILYDFSQTPEWNRMESNKPVDLTENRTALLRFLSDVGIPVFPEVNAQRQTLLSYYYENKFVNYEDKYSMIGDSLLWSSNDKMIAYLAYKNRYLDKKNKYIVLIDISKGTKDADVYMHLLKQDEIFVKDYTPKDNEEFKFYPEKINIDEANGNVKIKLNTYGLDIAKQNQELNINPITNFDEKYNVAELMNKKYTPRGDSNEKLGLAIAQLKEKEYHFGKIKEGEVISFKIKLLNTGKEDLIIKSVDVPCNCTKAKIKDTRIKPAMEGAIDCEYNSKGKIDKQEYVINIYTNDPQNSRLDFILKGEVIK